MATRRSALSFLSLAALAAACARVEGEENTSAAATPTETEGPFYPADTSGERDADLTRLAGANGRASGQVIQVRGRVLGRDGRPLANARVELWQANARGRYAHERDAGNPAPLDPNFQGYAQLTAGADGGFSLTTIKPGGYLVDEQGPRTPHLHWKFTAGERALTTQSYFPGEPANETDFLIKAMGEPARALIMQSAQSSNGGAGYVWDVVLG